MKASGVGHGVVTLALLFAASIAMAAENPIHCETSEQNGWLMVDESCPIGEGLWGREPKSTKGQFWVQCGLLNRVPTSSFANTLRQGVSEGAIVLRQEGSNYRCLVGPYASYSEALTSRNALRKQPTLNTAFIRSVSAGKEMMAPVAKAARVAKPAEKPTVQRAKANASGRRYGDVAGMKTPLPMADEQKYSTPEQTWWRATYQEAFNACKQDGMTLTSEAALRRALQAQSVKETLPNRLPFWVAERRAFDTAMGVAMPLSTESALLVLCE